jgi:hypothetical protein
VALDAARGSLASLASFGSLDSGSLAASLKPSVEALLLSRAPTAPPDASLPRPPPSIARAPSTLSVDTSSISHEAAAAAVAAVDSEQACASAAAAGEGQAAAAEGVEEGIAVAIERSLIREQSGLLRYRAPIDPRQRGKLESFDRKIGRAANALRVRGAVLLLHASRSSCNGGHGSMLP